MVSSHHGLTGLQLPDMKRPCGLDRIHARASPYAPLALRGVLPPSSPSGCALQPLLSQRGFHWATPAPRTRLGAATSTGLRGGGRAGAGPGCYTSPKPDRGPHVPQSQGLGKGTHTPMHMRVCDTATGQRAAQRKGTAPPAARTSAGCRAPSRPLLARVAIP